MQSEAYNIAQLTNGQYIAHAYVRSNENVQKCYRQGKFYCCVVSRDSHRATADEKYFYKLDALSVIQPTHIKAFLPLLCKFLIYIFGRQRIASPCGVFLFQYCNMLTFCVYFYIFINRTSVDIPQGTAYDSSLQIDCMFLK